MTIQIFSHLFCGFRFAYTVMYPSNIKTIVDMHKAIVAMDWIVNIVCCLCIRGIWWTTYKNDLGWDDNVEEKAIEQARLYPIKYWTRKSKMP